MKKIDKEKIGLSLYLTLFGMFFVFIFWRTPFLLIGTLLIFAYLKHSLIPIKKELQIYIISAILGLGVESIIMLSGAWSYKTAHILNFPVWLPFLWGLAGILGITIYLGLIEKF